MPNNPHDAAGRSKFPGRTSPVAPTKPRTAINQRIADLNVAQRNAMKPSPVPAQPKRGSLAVRAVPTPNAPARGTNPLISRHPPSIVQPKVAQPRMPGMKPQSLAVQRQLKSGIGQVRPGVASSPLLSKCGCGGPRPHPCNCHGGALNKSLQLSKSKKVKTPAWLKTWRNLKCYALDTAKAMEKRMTALEIEEYLKTFIKDHHSSGVRGHCSEGTTADPQPSGHTLQDLEIFHSYHRAHRPW